MGSSGAKTDTKFERSKAGIRELFDAQLRAEGVDCFTVFSEDQWQRGVLIPQETDTHLFYPELTYGSSEGSFAADVRSCIQRVGFLIGTSEEYRLEHDLSGDLQIDGAFFEDANRGPRTRVPPHLEKLSNTLGDLVRNFLEREQIASSAVFYRDYPSNRNSEQYPPQTAERDGLPRPERLPDILFFNFRKAQGDAPSGERNFADPIRRHRLARLAATVLDYVPILAAAHNTKAKPAAIRSVRAVASLVQAVRKRLDFPVKQGSHGAFFQTLADNLRLELETSTAEGTVSQPAEKADKLMVSIYLVERDRSESRSDHIKKGTAPELLLHRYGHSRDRSETKTMERTQTQDQKLGSSPPSVTILTTLTGCTHVIQRVDEHDKRTGAEKFNRVKRTSIPLTTAQFRVLLEMAVPIELDPPADNTITTASPTKWAVNECSLSIMSLQEDVPPGAPGYYLLLSHTPLAPLLPNGQFPQDLIDLLGNLRASTFGNRWPGLVNKLSCRLKIQHSHVFGLLDSEVEWDLPSSEVCVPIRFAGQCIGCINIESSRPNQFNPTYIGILSLFASIVGMEVARRRDRELDDSADRVIEAFHATGAAQSSDETKSPDVASDQLLIGDYAAQMAENCWAKYAYFVCEPSHQDAPLRFLGVSHPQWHERHSQSAEGDSAGWFLPRKNGWTQHVLDMQQRDARSDDNRGIVGVMISPRKDKIAEQSWWIKGGIKRSSTAKDSTDYNIDLIPTDGDNRPSFDAHKSMSDLALLIGLVVPDRRSESKEHRRRVVLWLAYTDHPVTIPLQSGGAASVEISAKRVRREQFIEHVVETSRQASGIVDHWQTALLQRVNVEEDRSHPGPEECTVRRLLANLGKAENWIPNDRADATSYLLALSWTQQERDIATALSGFNLNEHKNRNPSNPLQLLEIKDDHFQNICSQFRIQLNDRGNELRTVQDAVQIATRITAVMLRAQQSASSDWDNPFVITSVDMRGAKFTNKFCPLLMVFLLRQATSNAWNAILRHANPSPPTLTISRPDSSGPVSLRMENRTGLFPDSMLQDKSAYRRRLPLLTPGTKQGRGFDLMLRAARILNPNTKSNSLQWGNLDAGGAYVSFEIAPEALLT